jgi:hypothetical protein
MRDGLAVIESVHSRARLVIVGFIEVIVDHGYLDGDK